MRFIVVKLLHHPQGGPLALARTTGHAASTGDVATAATTATDWAGFVPVATPCYLANVANAANAANASDEKQGEISRISNVSSVSRVAMGVANVALPVVQAQTQAPDWTPSPPLPDPGMARLLALAACTPMQARGTIQPKAKAPACEDALGQVVAAPTVSGVLSCLNSWGLVRLHEFRMVYGRGGGYLQGRPHGLSRVFNRHAHPLRVKTHPVVLKSRQGAPTMQVNPMGQTAPTPKAAPAISPTEAQAHASLAGFYLRKGNIAQARRKLRQALQALNALEVAHA